jgi:glutamine phosphoribosylpyrophosphate amidotransferase
MCGIVGAILIEPSQQNLSLLGRVFFESRIRGKHATGIAYVKNNQVVIDRRPVPANQFPFDFESYLNEDGNLYLIGHCRYSTSDLEYNQPIGNDTKAIVHNGVITQELPENWKSIYGYDTVTKNDSELVLHSEDPLREFSHMSMGVCEINADKSLKVYRNGKRPLYLSYLPNGYIITSTSDIARRAGLDGPMEVPMNFYMTIDGNSTVQTERVLINDEFDFQKVEYETVHV